MNYAACLLFFFILFISAATTGSNCPCYSVDDPVVAAELQTRNRGGNGYPAVIIDPVLCLRDTTVESSFNGSALHQLWLFGFNFRFIDGSTNSASQCDALIEVTERMPQQLSERTLCPKQCSPLPTVSISAEIITPSKDSVDGSISMALLGEHRHFALTCSMTVDHILRNRHQQRRKHAPIFSSRGRGSELSGVDPAYLLQQVAARLLHECHEKLLIRYSRPKQQSKHNKRTSGNDHTVTRASSSVFRRKVQAVIVWIGSEGTRSLIEQQSRTLSAAAVNGMDAVVAWAATDKLYGCKEGTTGCRGGNARFNNLLPASNIRYMKPGWNCAQRRPLRALAHVLHLFDPIFVALLDDDTFFNYNLLMKRYQFQLFGAFKYLPHFFGEYQGKTGSNGHLTSGGIFAGGSGYILGRKLLQILQRREIHAFGHEQWSSSAVAQVSLEERARIAADNFRSSAQILSLSVLSEGITASKSHCRSKKLQQMLNVSAKPWAQLSTSRRRTLQSNTYSSYDNIGVSGVAGGVRSNIPQGVFNDESTDYNTCILSMRGSGLGEGQNIISNRNGIRGSSSPIDINNKLPIAVRLVDFCANLMANENTCLHSDHSLGRCLMYAAHAAPVGVACHSSVALYSVPADVYVGMCFTAPVCNTSEQVTCHRYVADPSSGTEGQNDMLQTVRRTKKEGGYYKVYSSIFDGNLTDTFM